MTKQITCQKAVDLELDKMRFPVWGFRKVDGQRGVHNIGMMTTREHKPFGNPDITAMFSGPEYAGFDGEFTVDGRLNGPELCNKTGSVLSQKNLKKGETALPTNVVWNLFDWTIPSMIDQPYEIRYINLRNYLETNSHLTAQVKLLPYVWIHSAEEARAWIDDCLENDYEGAIFRDPKALHKSGRATAKLNDFWRFKPTSEKTVRVVRVEEAMENTNEAKLNPLGRTERSTAKEGLVGKGMIGTYICEDEDGREIRVGPGKSTHAEREAWFQDQTQIIGWDIDYLSLDTGVKDAPRQARFIRRKLPMQVAA